MKSTISTKYRNNEELYFSYYLDELKEQGLIESYEYESESFLLSDEVTFNYTKTTVLKTKTKVLKTKTKVENKTKTLLHKHSYTPDFKVKPSSEGTSKNIFFWLWSTLPIFITSGNVGEQHYSWIDVKGSFSRNLSSSITFPLNQKWMLQKHNVYVQKIKPFDLFKQTFMPKLVIEEMKYKRDYIKKGKLLAKKGDSKLDYKPLTIEEWIKTI